MVNTTPCNRSLAVACAAALLALVPSVAAGGVTDTERAGIANAMEGVFLMGASVRYVLTQSGAKAGDRVVGERPTPWGASIALSLGIAFSVGSL